MALTVSSPKHLLYPNQTIAFSGVITKRARPEYSTYIQTICFNSFKSNNIALCPTTVCSTSLISYMCGSKHKHKCHISCPTGQRWAEEFQKDAKFELDSGTENVTKQIRPIFQRATQYIAYVHVG